jgi:hypothetical protein
MLTLMSRPMRLIKFSHQTSISEVPTISLWNIRIMVIIEKWKIWLINFLKDPMHNNHTLKWVIIDKILIVNSEKLQVKELLQLYSGLKVKNENSKILIKLHKKLRKN